MEKLVAALLTYRERQASLASIVFRSGLDADRSAAPILATLRVIESGSDKRAVIPFRVEEEITLYTADTRPESIVDTLTAALTGPWESGGCFLHSHVYAGAEIQDAAPGVQAQVRIRWTGFASWKEGNT